MWNVGAELPRNLVKRRCEGSGGLEVELVAPD